MSVKEKIEKAKRIAIKKGEDHQWWGAYHIVNWTIDALRASGIELVAADYLGELQEAIISEKMQALNRNDYIQELEARLADPGYVLVPREPTEEMIEGAYQEMIKPRQYPNHHIAERKQLAQIIYRAMLAAIDKEPEA